MERTSNLLLVLLPFFQWFQSVAVSFSLEKIPREEDIWIHALIFYNDCMAHLDQMVHDGDIFKLLHPV